MYICKYVNKFIFIAAAAVRSSSAQQNIGVEFQANGANAKRR
jgi:hypothetical protein